MQIGDVQIFVYRWKMDSGDLADVLEELEDAEDNSARIDLDARFSLLSPDEQEEVLRASNVFADHFRGVNGEVQDLLDQSALVSLRNNRNAEAQTGVVNPSARTRVHTIRGGGRATPSVSYEEVGQISKSSLQGRVTQVTSRIVLKNGSSKENTGDMVKVLDELFEIVEELLIKYVKSVAKEGDLAQMVFLTSQMEHPISTVVRKAEDLSPDHLMVLLEKSQNSGLSLKFEDQIELQFTLIKVNEGWETEPDVIEGSASKHRHLLYYQNFLEKKSIIRVAETNDDTCLAKALVVGKARLLWHNSRTEKDAKKGKKQSRRKEPKSFSEVMYEKEYERLRRLRKNNKLLKKKVAELYRKAKVKSGELGSLENLSKFEKALGVCVKVVSLPHLLKIVYKGKETGGDVIYLCYSELADKKIGHFDLIGNINGFFSKHYYCTKCDVAYNNVTDHKCPDVTNWCYSCFDRRCEGNGKETCKDCNTLFRSAECKKRHALLACARNWTCQKCKRKVPRMKINLNGESRKMNDAEMLDAHRCSDYHCTECDKLVEENHLCFIKRKELKPPNCRLLFFDFETDQSSGEHVINFVHGTAFIPKKGAQSSNTDLSDHEKWKGDWEEFSFKGYDALQEFMSMLMSKDKRFKGYTAVAHNLRGFDGVFVLKNLLINGVCPNVIVRGQKIMVLEVPGSQIRFIDSFNFLPMGLAKLPQAFGLADSCGSKGYFPHFYNRKENWFKGEVELPEPKDYGADTMSESERKKFMAWYSEELRKGSKFHLEKELAKYCIQDVKILKDCCLAYRRLMCEETGCDPFQYLTCASVCNAVYRSKFMPENTIARVPVNGYPGARYSSEALEWLSYVEKFEGKPGLLHAANSSTGEKRLGRFLVDGYDEASKTAYEFYGCFYHGCNKCNTEKGRWNPVTKKLHSHSLRETLEREKELKSLGYKVVVMWECEWKEKKRLDPVLSERLMGLNVPSPLYPRDAFFGGRTESFKVLSENAEVGYEDITSLYPWVNFTAQYPVGHPQIITQDFKSLNEYFGLIKCEILPPKDLNIPVLPMHAGTLKKLLFPLCRTCAETFQTGKCAHSENERALSGTWFIEEVKLAVEKGYELRKIHSIWHFEETSTELFREYVQTFYKKKLLSTKLPFESDEEIEKYIQQVFEKEGIRINGKNEFKPNPGLRQLTKLMLNNLWGRFGMGENMSKTCFVSAFEELLKMVFDETIQVQAIRLVSDRVVQVIYASKSKDFLALPSDTNIFVAVATTSWARIRLYRELDQVKERVIYCDTDSVVYERSKDPQQNLKVGNFLGEMTNELDDDDCIVRFVTGGPKNYAYQTRKGKFVAKIKGFTLNAVNAPAFSFDNMRNVILEGLRTVHDMVPKAPLERIGIQCPKVRKVEIESQRLAFLDQHLETPDRASAFAGDKGISVYNPCRIFRARDWKIFRKAEQKLYSFFFNKRIILSNMNTVPFGYVGKLG